MTTATVLRRAVERITESLRPALDRLHTTMQATAEQLLDARELLSTSPPPDRGHRRRHRPPRTDHGVLHPMATTRPPSPHHPHRRLTP